MISKRKMQIENSKRSSEENVKALSDDEGDRSFCPFEQALPRSHSNMGPTKRFSPSRVSPNRISLIDREMQLLGIT